MKRISRMISIGCEWVPSVWMHGYGYKTDILKVKRSKTFNALFPMFPLYDVRDDVDYIIETTHELFYGSTFYCIFSDKFYSTSEKILKKISDSGFDCLPYSLPPFREKLIENNIKLFSREIFKLRKMIRKIEKRKESQILYLKNHKRKRERERYKKETGKYVSKIVLKIETHRANHPMIRKMFLDEQRLAVEGILNV